MSKKVYISGKITGIEDQASAIFDYAERQLKARGFTPVNPMTLNHEHDKSWHSYMKEDVKALCDCDAIYMLTNWQDSKGAIIEHMIAVALGIKVMHQEHPLDTRLICNHTSGMENCSYKHKDVFTCKEIRKCDACGN